MRRMVGVLRETGEAGGGEGEGIMCRGGVTPGAPWSGGTSVQAVVRSYMLGRSVILYQVFITLSWALLMSVLMCCSMAVLPPVVLVRRQACWGKLLFSAFFFFFP